MQRSVIWALDLRTPMGSPKSTCSTQAGLRASANTSAETIVPTRSSIFAKILEPDLFYAGRAAQPVALSNRVPTTSDRLGWI